MNTKTRFLLSALLIILAAGPAYPQNRDIQLLNRDVLDVRERINQLQMTIDRDNALLKSLVERMVDQVNTLSVGLQSVNKAVDGIRSQGEGVTKELRTSLKSVTDSVKEMQNELTTARGQLGSITQEIRTLKTTSEPLASVDDLWRNAMVDYQVGNWTLSINGLQEFLSKYPNDPRAAEAELRIGDAMYAQKKFDAAITQYDIVLQKYPESDKTRTALLKKGLAQAEASQPQASSTLSEVIKKFPNTSEALTAQTKLKEIQSAQKPRTPAR